MGKKFGISFSWKRAVGISGLKNKISRKTGIPLTKSGRQRKLGRMMGCRTIALIYLLIFFSIIAFPKWMF
jgi:hypothetical protein